MQKKCLFYSILLWLVLNTTALEANEYQCNRTSQTIDGTLNYITVFSNVTLKGLAIPQLLCDSYYISTVTFESSSLEQIPQQLFDKFQFLTSADFINSGIKRINRSNLKKASSLKHLNLSGNALEELSADCFSGAVALEVLDLSFNNIVTIDEMAFNSSNHLNLLVLVGNKLRSLGSKVFQPLSSLQMIFLGFNQLQVIHSGLFSKNRDLWYVFLNDNNINVVEEGAFGGNSTENSIIDGIALNKNKLTKLNVEKIPVRNLDLANNMLEELHLPPWVEFVHAANNSITKIIVSEVTKMKLETLRLANNNITSLESIQHFHSLNYLDLSNNNIDPLNVTTFTKLTKLGKLELHQTSISHLPQGIFAHQEALWWLDLSYNNLDSFDFDILPTSSSISNIYLDGNRLKSINFEHLKKKFSNLTTVGLSDNKWNCSYTIQVLRFCYEHSIKLIKPQKYVQQQTNVNDTLQQIMSFLNCTTEESVHGNSGNKNEVSMDTPGNPDNKNDVLISTPIKCDESVHGNSGNKNGVLFAMVFIMFFMLVTIVFLLVKLRCQSLRFENRCKGNIDITITDEFTKSQENDVYSGYDIL